MAEVKRVTIMNQREGKVILPPDADELKANPKAQHRILLAGQAIEVTAEEAAKLLSYPGMIDAATITKGVDSAEVKRLKAELAAAKAENVRLAKKGGKPAPAVDADDEDGDIDTGVLDAKKGAACTLPDGGTGVIQSVNKFKKTAKVKLDVNGNVSEFDVDQLKPVPAGAAA